MDRSELDQDEFAAIDGVGQRELLSRGEVTSLELMEVAIGRLERLDSELGAVVHPTFDAAREAARDADRSRAQNPDMPGFGGIPFLLKDAGGEQAGEFHHVGMKVRKQIGSKASVESAYARQAHEGGLFSFGRTNTPELALLPTTEPEAYGPTRNPWNLDHSAGGSSGGSAAAVAAGIVAMAHASDGGGSIRGPATKCGLVGLKPTRGRCSLGPNRGERWSGLSSQLVVSRTVRDSAAAMDLFGKPVAGDPYAAPAREGSWSEALMRDPGRLRIGFMEVAPREIDTHPDVREVNLKMARTLEGLGHEVVEKHPDLIEAIEPTMTYVRIVAANIARSLDAAGTELGRPLTEDDVEPLTWALAQRARDLSAADHLEDLEFIHDYGYRMAQYWEDEGLDLLLSPTQALPPARIGEISSTREEPFRAYARAGPYGVFTLPFNLTGQPAISVPAGYTTGSDPAFPAGLPIGSQFAAPTGREDVLLQIARQLEEELDWSARRPPVFG